MSENWEYVKLESICHIIGGGTPSKKDELYYNGNIPWATVRDMKSESIVKTEHTITELGLKKSSSNIIPKDNIVIATRVGLGKVCLLKNDTAINQDLKGILPKKESVTPKFLYWYFLSVSEKIIKNGTGATVQGVKLPFIKSLEVPNISLQEQQQIVALLDQAFTAIDQAKANIEKNIANAKELFQSKLNDIFSQKGEGWEEKTLGEVCENLDSKRIPITKNKRVPGEIPYYGASGIVDYVEDYLFDEELLLVSEDGANLLARTYPIAFSISGKNWVNNHAHVLKFKNKTSQVFIEYYLNSIKLNDYISGMAQPKLNQRMLNSILVPFPSIQIQEKIVDTVEKLSFEINNINSNYNKKLIDLEDLKKSILEKAFAGELTHS